MFAIEATNAKNWRWISGIFQHRSAAEAFLLSIPPEARTRQRIIALQVRHYPVFIIEDKGFEYGGIDMVKGRLRNLVLSGDEDHIHMNIYAVREDFIPEKPGSDVMGGLLHWHITDETLRAPRSTVFDRELSDIAGEA